MTSKEKRMPSDWKVHFSSKAHKQYDKLKTNGIRPPINDIIDFLASELKSKGPEMKTWPNYGKLAPNKYHCHLKKRKPTFVACWAVIDKKLNQIEIYYVGTHEDAPY